MDRRGFLRSGSVAGLGATVGTGCIRGLLPPPVTEAEIKQIIAEMDGGLDRLSRYDMVDAVERTTAAPLNVTSDDRELTRKSVRAMYTSAVFRSMPTEAQLHPAVQDRVLGQLPEIDEAVFGMTARIAKVTGDERDDIGRTLRADRAIPEHIGQTFDRGMSALHMTFARRSQVRSIFKQVGWRMQKQSPSTVIDEYVDKVARVTGKVGSQAELERRVVAQIGNDAYWRHQQRIAGMFALNQVGPGGGAPAPTPPQPPQPQPPPQPPPPPVPTPPYDDVALAKELRWLTDSAHAAAVKGRCETVDFINARVLEIDPEFHTHVFMTDDQILKCLEQFARGPKPAIVEPSRCPPAIDPLPLARDIARKKVIGTGGWMFGIGLVTGLLGVVALGGGGEGAAAFALTMGVVLFVGGIIVMLVGSGMKSSKSPA